LNEATLDRAHTSCEAFVDEAAHRLRCAAGSFDRTSHGHFPSGRLSLCGNGGMKRGSAKADSVTIPSSVVRRGHQAVERAASDSVRAAGAPPDHAHLAGQFNALPRLRYARAMRRVRR